MKILKVISKQPDGTVIAIVNPEYYAINQPRFKVTSTVKKGYIDVNLITDEPSLPSKVWDKGDELEYLGGCNMKPDKVGPFRKLGDKHHFYATFDDLEHVEGSGKVYTDAKTFQEGENQA